MLANKTDHWETGLDGSALFNNIEKDTMSQYMRGVLEGSGGHPEAPLKELGGVHRLIHGFNPY